MELLGADADLGTEAELKAVREPGRCIVIYRCSVNLLQEACSIRRVFSYNTFGMLGAEFRDMSESLFQGVNDTNI